MKQMVNESLATLEGSEQLSHGSTDVTALAESLQAVSTTLADTGTELATTLLTANNVWMMIATALVFIMHLGFAGVEAGFTQSKNTVNILFKNTLTPAIGLLAYAFIGFNLMYPGGEDFWFGFAGWALEPSADYNSLAYADGVHLLDRLFVPGHVCCNRCHHCLRCCG